MNARKPLGMWDDEKSRPRLYAALYAAAFIGSLLISHASARGWI